MANVTQGPAGNDGVVLRERLAAQGKRLPILDGTDEQANKAYAKEFALGRDRERGRLTAWPTPNTFITSAPMSRRSMITSRATRWRSEGRRFARLGAALDFLSGPTRR